MQIQKKFNALPYLFRILFVFMNIFIFEVLLDEQTNVCYNMVYVPGEDNMKNTTLCYIEKDGKYLMLHRVRKENDENRDKWIGIGGKFEAGESPEDCVLREAREETGLVLTDYRYRGIVTFVSDLWPTEYMHLFTATGYEGVMREDCDEGVLDWIDKRDLLALPMWEGDRIFLRLLDEDTPFFSLKLVYQGDSLRQAVLNGQTLDI